MAIKSFPMGQNHPLPEMNSPGPLRASHTPGFPELLNQLGCSLFVSTYQAGKLVLVRSEGNLLNTHFRSFQAPMGLAVSNDATKIALGTTNQVWEFQVVRGAAQKLNSRVTVDACFLPRSSHYTGNVQIHEMAYGKDNQLWFVNTRFSCLATLDRDSSFVPRWRPRFVSELEPSDRCHLNGMAMVDGQSRFVTALGETNTMGGWRENKAQGGILIDVDSDEVLCSGLSMPHSPRWHLGKLWLCESGSGTLGTIDISTGRYEAIASLPGFTRGLEFVGDLAIIGLSQVRETAVFSGIPITERLRPEQRICGLCVVDLRRGEVIALLKFDSGVQEVFGIAVLPRRFPDLITDDETLLENSFVVPDECLGEIAPTVRSKEIL